MELITGIKERRSVRKFQDKKIPHDTICEIVEAARFAPSWKNAQIARYIVIEDEEVKKLLCNEKCTLGFPYNVKTMAGAPALVLVTYITGRSGFEKDGSFSTPKGDGWEMFDAGIATQTFCLAAYAKGLGTVIMGIFDEEKIGEIVDIPQGQKIGAIVAIGYADDNPVAPKRKETEEIVSFI